MKAIKEGYKERQTIHSASNVSGQWKDESRGQWIQMS